MMTGRIMSRALLAVFLLLTVAPSAVMAQAAPDGGNSGMGAVAEAAKRPDDQSRKALVTIFGPVVNNPLAVSDGSGGGETLLAVVFTRLNFALLSIAGVLLGWGVFRRVANTARQGTVFDQAGGHLWGPLRMVWGLSAVIPTANGWSMAQLVMLWAASVMGIGSANLVVDAAATALQNGTPLVATPVLPQSSATARQLFEADLCMHGINYGLASAGNAGGLVDPSEYVSQVALPDGSGFVLTDAHHTYSCGGATIDATKLQPQQVSTNLTNLASFDVSKVYQAHKSALIAMQQTLDPAAKAYVQAIIQRQHGQNSAVPDPEVAIQSAASAYENTVQAQVGEMQGDMRALSTKVVDNLKTEGWWMLGSWYQTFAVANTKLSDAISSQAVVQAPSLMGASGPSDVWQTALSAFHAQEANSTAATPQGQSPSGPRAANSAGGTASALFASVFAPGQKFLGAMTHWGYGSTERGQVNPLIQLKNMGDYTIGAAEAALGVVVGLEVVNQMKSGFSWIGLAARVGNLVTGLGDAYSGALKVIYPYLMIVIGALFLFGLTLSVYIPMVPFITWFGGVVNWLVAVAEGVIAASLWAIAHLLSDGEGVGGRALHGYFYLLNMITRPLLMVAGFFAGGVIMVAAGTFLAEGFSVAVANAQFDSITGVFSILAFYWIFVQLSLTLVHSSFNLILLVPDRVIAWLGGATPMQLGTDTNQQARHGFDAGREKAGSTHGRGSDRAGRNKEPKLAGSENGAQP